MRSLKMAGIGLISGLMLLAVVGCSGSREQTGGAESGSAAPPETAARDSGALPLSGPVESRGASGDGAAAAAAVADALGRKIVRNGSLTLEVESVTTAYDEVGAVAARLGGYVADGSYAGVDERRTGRLIVRVPADSYDQAVRELRGLAKHVSAASSSTQDVTGEVTDLDAALRNLRAVEAQYVTLLTQARTIQDMLQVQERLQVVRGDIERTEARLALLNRLSDLATISVQLTPVVVTVEAQGNRPSPVSAASTAWEASIETLRQIAVVGVAVVVYSWWLVPVVAAAAYVGRRQFRQRRSAGDVAAL
ncbi:MAG: DUF4349 domain-containing protein [Dehalococcoidia bacterium]